MHATKLSHPFVERERHYSCGSSNSTSVIQSETSDKTNLQNTRNKERTSLKGLRAKIRQVRGIGSTSNNQMDLKAKLVQKRPLSLLEFEFNVGAHYSFEQ